MEKALEVLTDMHSIYKGDHRITQALNELKAAMKPKTCDSCKHNDKSLGMGGMCCYGYTCIRMLMKTIPDGYEPKEKA